MTTLSPLPAALEGFRLMRREPGAVLAWMGLWLAALSLAAWAVALGKPVQIPSHAPARSLADIAHLFGPFGVVFIGLFLLLWAVTTVAAYRAVLRPADRRWFFLRVGADELRVAVMTAAAFGLALVFGSAPAYLLYVLFSPIMRALPDLARDVAGVGALITVCLEVWLGVRLSLIAVEAFSERRFHLSAYWPVTRGRFWYLLACYFLFFLVVFGLSLVIFSVNGFLFETAVAKVAPGDFVRRLIILAMAGALAVLDVSFWVISSTLFCACQAYAFRAIVGRGKAGVAPA